MRGTTTTVVTVGTAATAASAVSFIGTSLPRRIVPSAVMSAFASASCEPDRDRVGAVAGEHREEDRTELRDRHHRRDRLGDHREEDADRVTLADTSRLEPVRDPVGEHAQLAVAQRPRRSLFAFPHDRGPVPPVVALGPLVDAVVRDVQLPAGEPRRPLDARGRVEHLRVRRRPLDPDEPHERVPEPLGLGDRPGPEVGEVVEAVLGHEPADVARGRRLRRGSPHDLRHGRQVMLAQACDRRPLGRSEEPPTAARQPAPGDRPLEI